MRFVEKNCCYVHLWNVFNFKIERFLWRVTPFYWKFKQKCPCAWDVPSPPKISGPALRPQDCDLRRDFLTSNRRVPCALLVRVSQSERQDWVRKAGPKPMKFVHSRVTVVLYDWICASLAVKILTAGTINMGSQRRTKYLHLLVVKITGSKTSKNHIT